MSRSTLYAVGGAAIGFAVGGPGGAKWGWAIGSALAPSDAPDQSGPRLNDLDIQDSSYGLAIPIVYGRDRIAGNIIWSKPLEEVKNEEEQGKGGGPTVTTFNYFATFALGLCEGEITGVRRIWIDSKLVYKYTEDATVEELLASNATIDGITVYTGSESQDPDPLIQADKGADNTPAFRGLAYLVFERLDVGNSGRIPNITVEVVGNGTTSEQGFIESYTVDSHTYTGNYWEDIGPIQHYSDGAFDLFTSWDTANYTTSTGLKVRQNETIDRYTITGEKIGATDISNTSQSNVTAAEKNYISSKGYLLREYGPGADQPIVAGILDSNPAWISVQNSGARQQLGSESPSGTYSLPYGNITQAGTSGRKAALGDIGQVLIDNGDTGLYVLAACCSPDESFMVVLLGTYPGTGTTYTITRYRKIEIVAGEPTITAQASGSVAFSLSNFRGAGMGHNNVEPGSLAVDAKSGKLWTAFGYLSNLQVSNLDFSGGTITQTKYTLSPVITTGGRPKIYVKDGIAFVFTTNNKIATFSDNPVISTTGVTLSNIVTDICERAGLDASDIDVSDLTDTVQGYTVTRVMSARKAIEPLMQTYFFDGGEYSNKLNFVKRGGSVVTTIPEDDLGVDSDELYTQTRQQEAELPSELILNFKAVNRDFQPGSQRSRRINTQVENVRQIDVPIALTANQAKRKCEISHYNAWVERDRFQIQVSDEYLSLNPTDVLQFTADGITRKGRIIDISYGPMIRIEMVAESGNYSSDAVAGESESVDQTLGLIGPTNLQLLDIPLLRNRDNDTAIYTAASGYYNAWSGCRIYKSTDNVSFSEVDALFNSVTQGYTTGALADASHTVWDRTSTVTVRLTSGTLSSSTESNVLKGANTALIGNEIVNFVTATDNGNGSYTLSTLLRGRRGTDWATNTHAANDRFILLEESKMGRLDVVLNTARYFKGVSIGNYLANADSETLTNTGVSLKPFSPTRIRGTRDGSNNLTVTWLNRSRYIGGALMPLPLFEDTESYKVEILGSPGGSVLRTISSITSKTTTYTAAQQTTDGLTPGNPVHVKVYQYSGTVGYGYGKEATV